MAIKAKFANRPIGPVWVCVVGSETWRDDAPRWKSTRLPAIWAMRKGIMAINPKTKPIASSFRKKPMKAKVKWISPCTERRLLGKKMATRARLKPIRIGAGGLFFEPMNGARLTIGRSLARVKKKTERTVVGSRPGIERSIER